MFSIGVFLFAGLLLSACNVDWLDSSTEDYLALFKNNTVLKQAYIKKLILPMTLDRDGLPLIMAHLYGDIDRPCIFDTGSQPLFINSKYAKKFHKVTQAQVSCSLTNAAKTGDIIIVPDFVLAGCNLRNIPAVSLTLDHLNAGRSLLGITGSALFFDSAVTLDFNSKQITIQSPSTLSISKDAYVLPFKTGKDNPLELPMIEIEGYVQDVPVNFTIDTGCAKSSIPQRIAKRAKLLSNAKDRQKATLYGVLNLKIFDCKPEKIDLGNKLVLKHPILEVMTTEAGFDGTGGVIGADLLKFYRTTIDYPGRRLIFENYKERI